MKSGRLRTPLIYQTSTDVDDGAGSVRTEWADSFALWGSVRPTRPDETVQAGPQVGGTIEYDVLIRFDARVSETGRLRIAGTDRVFALSAPGDRDFRGVELSLKAFEVLSPTV